ncbi:acidic proline-rich protein PRP33-like [Uranotaenia lowii]|uniref:acidic proline-rich protein PRP33-like n=1 Tax=Uranotaenia lowii TaxID=190385 RepID=UPI00247B1FFE|nr:acidic proline-rich protein PRP33-like [Uranotaenia lowii]
MNFFQLIFAMGMLVCSAFALNIPGFGLQGAATNTSSTLPSSGSGQFPPMNGQFPPLPGQGQGPQGGGQQGFPPGGSQGGPPASG